MTKSQTHSPCTLRQDTSPHLALNAVQAMRKIAFRTLNAEFGDSLNISTSGAVFPRGNFC